jgi:hypothetical protein
VEPSSILNKGLVVGAECGEEFRDGLKEKLAAHSGRVSVVESAPETGDASQANLRRVEGQENACRVELHNPAGRKFECFTAVHVDQPLPGRDAGRAAGARVAQIYAMASELDRANRRKLPRLPPEPTPWWGAFALTGQPYLFDATTRNDGWGVFWTALDWGTLLCSAAGVVWAATETSALIGGSKFDSSRANWAFGTAYGCMAGSLGVRILGTGLYKPPQ